MTQPLVRFRCQTSYQEIHFLITLLIFRLLKWTLRKLKCTYLFSSASIIIFILQTQQKLIDHPDLIIVSEFRKHKPALLDHLPGFHRTMVISQSSLCFLMCDCTGRLNLLNLQCGALSTCTQIKTHSGRAENGLSRPNMHIVPTPTNLWSGAAGKT